MFDKLVFKLLEGFNIYPRSKPFMKTGPNAIGPGPLPQGFLGGGLPGINPGQQQQVLIKSNKKIKRKKPTKKNPRY